MEMQKKIEKLEAKIRKIQGELMATGPMRPGTLSQQYRKPAEKAGPFWQLSYTYQMKSRSEYVRPESLARIRKETANFKKWKALLEKWTALELERSQLISDAEKSAGKS